MLCITKEQLQLYSNLLDVDGSEYSKLNPDISITSVVHYVVFWNFEAFVQYFICVVKVFCHDEKTMNIFQKYWYI